MTGRDAIEDVGALPFASRTEMDFGTLYHSAEDRTCNIAVVRKAQVRNLEGTLRFIKRFYQLKGVVPTIVQSAEDSGYFEANEALFNANDFQVTSGLKVYKMTFDKVAGRMGTTAVVCLEHWDERLATQLCIPFDAIYKIPALKSAVQTPGYRLYAVQSGGRYVGAAYGHWTKCGGFCLDDVFVAPPQRRRGIGTSLICKVLAEASASKSVYAFTEASASFEALGFSIVQTLDTALASLKG